MNKRFISKLLVGSHLYGLQSEESDFDYTAIFVPQPEEFVSLSPIKDSLPTLQIRTGSVTQWSIQKWLSMCAKNSYGGIELLYAKDEKRAIEWDMLKQCIRPEHFWIKPIMHTLISQINASKQRGYLKAYSFLLAEYLYQNERFPVSLDWKELVDNTKSFRKKGEIIDILSAKCSGIKNVSSSFEDESTTWFDWLECDYVKPEQPNYNALLRKVVFYNDDV